MKNLQVGFRGLNWGAWFGGNMIGILRDIRKGLV